MVKGFSLSILIAVFSLFLFWFPFLFKIDHFWGISFANKGMEHVVQNFDGINFLVVAKTLYQPEKILEYPSILSGREPLYFSAHYPLYPLLIRAFDQGMDGPEALLGTIIFSNILLAAALWYFFSQYLQNPKLAIWLTALALFLPARILAVRAVGSNEPLFIALLLFSLTAAAKGKHWLSGILAALATLTRSPGILLFVAYFLTYFINHRTHFTRHLNQLVPYLLIPISLIGLWAYYGVVFGSFWAYFQVGGNINLHFPPFLIFGSNNAWVSGIWLEDIIYTYLFISFGILAWSERYTAHTTYRSSFVFAGIYLLSIVFIAHRDIARYALPIVPFALLGYSSVLHDRKSRILLLILLIPVFLWSWNFVVHNFQPIVDWSAFL